MQSQLLRPRQVRARTVRQVLGVLEAWQVPAQLHSNPTQLHSNVEQTGQAQQISMSGITLASSRVAAGDLYVALSGASAHGADFVGQAVQAGAVAILTDAAGWQKLGPQPPLPVVVVENPRAVLGRLSAWMYGDPAQRLRMVAVTGTNGKTTTSYMIDACLRQAGINSGLIGTVETRLMSETGPIAFPSARTTPEAPDLHALFAVMLEHGASAVVMEVSSHALCLERVDGITFDLAVFTNLSQDHLDFHHTMEEYFAAKASLFTPHRAQQAVVCIDDQWGRRLAEQTSLACLTYSGSNDPAADWRVEQAQLRPTDTHVVISMGRGECEALPAQVGLPGRFNVANAVAAAAVSNLLGLTTQQIAAGLGNARVPGRMERVSVDLADQTAGQQQDFGVLVDYAHTPAAVATALAAIREASTGRVWCVLGCGGDRDQAKRPLMGQAAALGAEVVVITDDNPRSEDPATIRAAMMAGISQIVTNAQVEQIADRAQAIEFAINGAQTGDVVAILGKGHERGQETDSGVQPFDDRQVAMSAVRRRLGLNPLSDSQTGENLT